MRTKRFDTFLRSRVQLRVCAIPRLPSVKYLFKFSYVWQLRNCTLREEESKEVE